MCTTMTLGIMCSGIHPAHSRSLRMNEEDGEEKNIKTSLTDTLAKF